MRNFTSILRLLLIVAISFATLGQVGFAQQTILLNESFESGSGTTPPAGWAIEQVTGPASPPPYVTIGTGTYLSSYPYPTFWKGARTQMLYTAAELTAAGATASNFSSVGFNVMTNSTQVMNGFNLKLGATALTTLSAGYVNGLTSYYSTPYSLPGNGWQYITLATPFAWNGTSNVIVEICYANTSYTSNSTVLATMMPGMTAGHYADLQTECTTSVNSAPATRPNIRFGIPPITPGVLTGYVSDANTLAPIPGAVVQVGMARDTSRANGMYIFYNITPGIVNVTCSAAGYISQVTSQTIMGGSVTNYDILMSPGPRAGGTVTDISTGLPLTGAFVTVGTGASAITTMTVGGGTYLTPLMSISGVQPIVIGKTGYDNYTGTVTLVPNTIVTQDATLYPSAVQPGAFTAVLDDPVSPTAVNLSWLPHQGSYQLIYDDGVQDNFSVWPSANNLNAMRFTPLTWPVKVTGGNINIGSTGYYPPNFLPLTPFKILAYKADGPGGIPGTILDSVTVTANSTGWVWFSFNSPITLNAGDFYLAMKQGGTPPHAAGLAIDETTNLARSYSRDVSTGGSWNPVPGNFMIRASVQGGGGPLLDACSSGGDLPTAMAYEVYRLQQGQEGNSALWTSIWSGGSTSTTDNAWPILPAGPYRWAVKAIYSPPGMRYSAPTFSKVIGKNWTSNVDVCVALSCAADPIAGTLVTLTNNSYPDTSYSKTTDITGCVNFTNVWNGSYTLRAMRFSYPLYTQIVTINGNSSFNVSLVKPATPPANLLVNSLNLQASWTSTTTTSYLLNESWSSGSFVTNQWATSGGTNWQISGTAGNPAPTAIFNWTPSLTNYNQYLTTKSFAGIHAPQMRLQYDIFLDNYSTDNLNTMDIELWNGTTWTVIKTYNNLLGSIPWVTESVDISSVTNNPAFKIRFHASGTNSVSINTWAIDNIKIITTNGANGSDPCLSGYNFYLDNVLLGFTTDTTYAIPPGLVTYGQTYTACVASLFGAVLSTQVCIPFISYYLYPPLNLTASYVPETTSLNWDPPSVATGLTGYSIYRNNEFLVTLPANQLSYTDNPVTFGLNSYTVAAAYNLLESLHAGPVVVNAVPLLNSLNGLQVVNGMTACYNAAQVITVAGNGTSFSVENGGSATMIAGQKILFLPGTVTVPGGYLLGHIAPSGPFCNVPYMNVISGTEEDAGQVQDGLTFKVYPNPTSENFVLEITKGDDGSKMTAEVYGTMGIRVAKKVLSGESKCTFSLYDRPAGIYFIRVIKGDKVETAKIIKL